MHSYTVTHLNQLESEAMYVLRETCGSVEKTGALLFSWRQGLHRDGSPRPQGLLACPSSLSRWCTSTPATTSRETIDVPR